MNTVHIHVKTKQKIPFIWQSAPHTHTFKYVKITKAVKVEHKWAAQYPRGCASNRLQASLLMQGSSWLTKHQSLVSAAYMTPESVRGGLMCAPHILIMNSGTIWASHSGLARRELQGSPIHDQLIGKPVLSQGPIFTWCLSTETHSLPHLENSKPYPISQQSGNVLNDKVTPQ